MALLLSDLVLVFVQYLLVGVVIDSQKHQDCIFCRMDKLENCPNEEEKSGGKGQGRPEMFPKGLDFQNCLLAKHHQGITHVH